MELNKIRSVGGKVAKIRFGIVAALIGLIFVAIGGFATFSSFGKTSTYKSTSATITEIVPSQGDDEYLVYLSYEVDGKTYTNELTQVDFQNYNVGDKFTIYYEEGKPENISTSENGGVLLPVIILVVGLGALGVGVFSLVKTFKTKNSDQFSQVDMSKVTPEQIDAIKNSTEPTNEYYFHFEGKLNQSYVLETTDRKPLIKMVCDKIGVASQFKFTFTNTLTGKETNYDVSHTITHHYSMAGLNFPTKSTFKVNNEDVFKVIADMGFSVVAKMEGLKLNFDICHYGVKVASLIAAGYNVKEGKQNKLGNIPTPGVYTVNARESDLDAVALIAFAVSRVDFF